MLTVHVHLLTTLPSGPGLLHPRPGDTKLAAAVAVIELLLAEVAVLLPLGAANTLRVRTIDETETEEIETATATTMTVVVLAAQLTEIEIVTAT